MTMTIKKSNQVEKKKILYSRGRGEEEDRVC